MIDIDWEKLNEKVKESRKNEEERFFNELEFIGTERRKFADDLTARLKDAVEKDEQRKQRELEESIKKEQAEAERRVRIAAGQVDPELKSAFQYMADSINESIRKKYQA